MWTYITETLSCLDLKDKYLTDWVFEIRHWRVASYGLLFNLISTECKNKANKEEEKFLEVYISFLRVGFNYLWAAEHYF